MQKSYLINSEAEHESPSVSASPIALSMYEICQEIIIQEEIKMSETEGVDRTLDCNVSSMIIYCIVSVGIQKKNI